MGTEATVGVANRRRRCVGLYYGDGEPDRIESDLPFVAVRPHGLLEAAPGASGCALAWASYRGATCPTGADPLAGIFFCLSLLSEYADGETDAHGRPLSRAHPLVARGLAGVPVADRLAAAVARELWCAGGGQAAPALQPEPGVATSDVDAPAALANKSRLRRVAAVARAALATRGRFRDAPWSPRTVAAWLRGRDDPFDTFAYMHAAARSRGLREDVFTLTGYGTRLDPGFPAGDPAWPPFWRRLPPGVRLGIHPSYRTAERPELIPTEVAALREGIEREIAISRQHFLRLRLPTTFRTLIECGIREDHSLMWPDRHGFRAGTARSFRWYDLRRETATGLLLVPPHAMDVTARYYAGLGPGEAAAAWAALAAECRRSGVGLRCIWHNSNLGPWYGWWPWRRAYEASLDLSVIA